MAIKKRQWAYLVTSFAFLQLGFSNCSPTGTDLSYAENQFAGMQANSSLKPNAMVPRPQGVSPFSTDDELYAAGRILVKGKSSVAETDLKTELGKVGGQSIGKINGLEVHIVQLPENANEKAVAALLAHNPKFEFAEVDRLMSTSSLTNDPYYQYENVIIKAPDAWTNYNGAGQVIAILDSGVDATHPDLAASIVPGWNFYDNNSDTSDVYGHGTAVAGSAAAIGNNGLGVAGAANGAKIMPIRIADTNGYAYWSTLANGLTYAADHGATVANASFQAACSSTVQNAGSYMMNKGGVFVSSAGNSSADVGCADSPYIVVVSATNSGDSLTSWSNFGPAVDLSAPGEGVTTTMRGGGYGQWSGTSFAAPIVAGVAALVKQANPKLTASQVVSILKQSADDLGAAGYDTSYGAGRVNAARAVSMAAGSTTSTTTTLASTTTTTTIATTTTTLPASGTWTFCANEGSYCSFSGTMIVRYGANSNYVSQTLTGGVQCDNNTFGDPLVGVAKHCDIMPASSTSTTTTLATTTTTTTTPTTTTTMSSTPDTTAPVVQISNPLNGSTVRKSTTVSATASDNVAVSSMSIYIDGVLRASSSSGSVSFSWNTMKISTGAHTLRVEARDPAGNLGQSTIQVYK